MNNYYIIQENNHLRRPSGLNLVGGIIVLIIYMSGFMKMGLKNWTPNLDFNELLGLL